MCSYIIICRKHRDEDQLVRTCKTRRRTKRCARKTIDRISPTCSVVCRQCVKASYENDEIDEPQWMVDFSGDPPRVLEEFCDEDRYYAEELSFPIWGVTLPVMRRSSPLMARYDLSDNGICDSSNTSRFPISVSEDSCVPSQALEGITHEEDEVMDAFFSSPDADPLSGRSPKSQNKSRTCSPSPYLQIRRGSSASSIIISVADPRGPPISTTQQDDMMTTDFGFDEGMKAIEEFFA